MPVKLDSSSGIVACSDGYTDEATLGPFQSLSTVQFTVSTQPVIAQVAKMNANDKSLHWDPMEFTIPPGQGGFEGKVYGIRFRNAVAGQTADITATGYFEDDPIPFTSPQPFTGSLTPGGYTPAGINFNEENSGTFFTLATHGTDPNFPGTTPGIELDAINDDTTPANFYMQADGASASKISIQNNTGSLDDGNDLIEILANGSPATHDSSILIQANNSGGGGTGIKIESTGPTPVSGAHSLHLLTDTGQMVLETNAGGMLLEQFGGAAKIEFTPGTPTIDILASVELSMQANSDVIIEANAGNNGKITLGSGGGGNGGILMATPGNGATPTFELDIATHPILKAGDGFIDVISQNTQLQTKNATIGIYVQEAGAGPFHPVVEVCDDASGFLGFYGTAPIARISGATLTTVAQLVAALQNYGLLGP